MMFFYNDQKIPSSNEIPKPQIHDSKIERLTEFTFLGETITDNLDWDIENFTCNK